MKAPIITITAAMLAAALDSGAEGVPLELVPIWQTAPEPCIEIASLDLDGDAADELLCSGASGIWMWAGSWSATGNSIGWDSISIGDHDGDGLEDAVITVQGGYPLIMRIASPPLPLPAPTGLSVACGGIVQLHFTIAAPVADITQVQVELDGVVSTYGLASGLYYAGGSDWYVAALALPDAGTWRVRAVGGGWSGYDVYACS